MARCIDRMLYLDELIGQEATGTPELLAHDLGISTSSLRAMLNELRGMGAEIAYCSRAKTYVYVNRKRLRLGFYPMAKLRQLRMRGGWASCPFVRLDECLWKECFRRLGEISRINRLVTPLWERSFNNGKR